MSYYYGGVRGNRGEGTRGGTRNSGYRAWCQDHTHQVQTHMYVDEEGRGCARITVRASSMNHGNVPTKTLWDGPIEDLLAQED